MSVKKDLRPPVKIAYREVLGSPAYVLESGTGSEKVAFGNIEDVLLRLLKHFEPENMAERLAMPTPSGRRRKPQATKPDQPKPQGLTKAILALLDKPLTTKEIEDRLEKFYPYKATHAQVYASLWGLRRRTLIKGSGGIGEKWMPVNQAKAA